MEVKNPASEHDPATGRQDTDNGSDQDEEDRVDDGDLTSGQADLMQRQQESWQWKSSV